MKKLSIYIAWCIAVLAMVGCDKEAHKNEQGLVIELANTKDIVNDIAVWLFNTNGVLTYAFYFDSPKELALQRLQVESGTYQIVATTNIKEVFGHEGVIGKTTTEELLLAINNASSSPKHAHYATTDITIHHNETTHATLLLQRVMAQFGLTIHHVPQEVASAQFKIINSTMGYYPALDVLHTDAAEVSFDEITGNNGQLNFEEKRLMPTLSVDEAFSRMMINLKYKNGGSLVFEVTTPQLLSGGVYHPEINYSILRPGIVIQISNINGWIELDPISGEILNPNL